MKTLEVTLVRSKPSSDAVARLISDPLIRGLQERGVHARIVSPDLYRNDMNDCDFVIFHYDDKMALEAIRRKKKICSVLCLGSDIYDFEIYINSHDIVDMYFAPTEVHCSILRSQLTRPVCLLPEAIDVASSSVDKQRRPGKSICWFGYPESFGKAMASLMPVIEYCLEENLIDRFAVITDVDLMGKNDLLEILPYSFETFDQDVSEFDYAILSHFALDLHINSIIKSPNKLITAICSGLIPLASATPNYSDVLYRYKLDRFLFDSPLALLKILRTLDPERDFSEIRNSEVRASLMQEFSPARTSEAFIAGLSQLGEFADDRWLAETLPRQWSAKTEVDDEPSGGFIRTLKDRVFRRWTVGSN